MNVIEQKIREYYEKKKRVYPVNALRASEIGHPCKRYLFLQLTKWQEKALPDEGLLRIFDFGNAVENYVNKVMLEAGIPIIEGQRAYEYPEPKITGHIDGKVLIEGKAYPIEIKGLSDANWRAINSVEDMLNSRQYYIRKYPYQLNLYMLMSNEEKGYFILFNKQNANIKVIEMKLDYELGEETLKKAEEIYKAVKENREPAPVDDITICANCPFNHICLPEMQANAELELETDPELEQKLQRLEELKKYKKEYEQLDKEITAKLKMMFENGTTRLAIGSDWLIQGKKIQKRVYDIPKEIKSQYERIMEYWRKDIKRLGGQDEEETE